MVHQLSAWRTSVMAFWVLHLEHLFKSQPWWHTPVVSGSLPGQISWIGKFKASERLSKNKIKQKQNMIWVWRGSPEVESTCCYYRGPEFNYQELTTTCNSSSRCTHIHTNENKIGKTEGPPSNHWHWGGNFIDVCFLYQCDYGVIT